MIFGSELQCPCRYLLLPAFPVGFLIVTAAADKGLVDIHDRRPLVLVPDAAREWMKQDVSGKEAEEIAADGAVSADHFIWHPVTRAVGNVKNQGPELIEPVGC